jgi:hypothetical protein
MLVYQRVIWILLDLHAVPRLGARMILRLDTTPDGLARYYNLVDL